MAENNQTKQTATIYYDSPRPVRIGDVFYRVEHGTEHVVMFKVENDPKSN